MAGRSSIASHLTTSDARVRPSLIWRLALPVLGQNLLGMFVGWSDAILAGQILVEEKYLAAGAVVSYLLWLIQSFSALIATGSEAMVARMIGAGDRRSANETVLQSLLLAVGLGALVGLGVFFFADRAAAWMALAGDSRLLAADYLRIIAVCCVPMMVLLVGVDCLRAAGHTLPGMWILSTVNLVNMGASWLLTLGVGPIAPMGWRGIAAGTSLGFGVGGILTLWLLFRGHAELRLPRQFPWPEFTYHRRLLRIGIPGAANSLAVVFFHLWFVSIISGLGNSAVAAHGVAIRCESLSWLSAEAFAIAASTLVGQSLGARRPDLARRYGWASTLWGVIFLSVLGAIFYFAAPWLFAIFVRGQQSSVLEQGIPVLRLVAFGMPSLAAAIVLSGALRGAGDTRGPLVYNTAGLLFVRIPLAYALTGLVVSLGLYGAWIAMLADLYARGLLAVLRFLAAGWTKIRV